MILHLGIFLLHLHQIGVVIICFVLLRRVKIGQVIDVNRNMVNCTQNAIYSIRITCATNKFCSSRDSKSLKCYVYFRESIFVLIYCTLHNIHSRNEIVKPVG
eukprot:NODE_815_length_3982_cov_0.697141.p3 type:complete len:102 gc:universal NODE_815_length_3982_cov_0.697141:2249-1944(-)